MGQMDRRIAQLTGLNVRTPYGEYLQVVNYGIGGHYEPHFDHATVSDWGRVGDPQTETGCVLDGIPIVRSPPGSHPCHRCLTPTCSLITRIGVHCQLFWIKRICRDIFVTANWQ